MLLILELCRRAENENTERNLAWDLPNLSL